MLSKFPNKTLKVGAKVSLSPQHSWSRANTNPVGEVGTVIAVNEHSTGMLRVQWSNGYTNHYDNTAYDLIAEGEPGYLETI